MTTTKAMLGVVKRLHEGQAKDKDEASLAQKTKQNDPLLHKPDKWTNKKGPKRTMKPAKPPPNLKQLEMQQNIKNLMGKKLGESMAFAQKTLFEGKYIEQQRQIQLQKEEIEQKMQDKLKDQFKIKLAEYKLKALRAKKPAVISEKIARKNSKSSMDRNSLNSSPLKMLQITVISTHDWENTPMYKQFVLGETEEESLKDTDIMQTIIKELISEKMKVKMKGMFNLNKKKIKGKKGGIRSKSGSPTSDSDRSKSINDVRDNILGALGGVSFGIGAGLGKAFDADKHGDGMLTEAMNRVRTKMLEEQEIEYTLGVLKKSGNNVQKEDKKIYFQKAKITLEILMTKMGLHALYKSIIDQYENMFKSQDTEAFDETLIKLLYRCLMIKRSIQKTQKIFKLIEKRDAILKDFIDMVAKDEQQNGSELGSR